MTSLLEIVTRTNTALAQFDADRLESLAIDASRLVAKDCTIHACEKPALIQSQACLRDLLRATARNLHLFQTLRGDGETSWVR